MAAERGKEYKIDGQRVRVSNPEKVLFPESRISKEEYVRFYLDVAKYAVPHLRGRPISLERFPDGIASERFFQKEIPEYVPEYFRRTMVQHGDEEPKPYGIIDNAASLVYAANLVAVIHVWTSRADRLEHPDRIVWDMDPMNVGFDRVRAAARLFKYLLEEVGLIPHLMTTGSRGLHVVVAIEPGHDTDFVFAFSRDLSELAAAKLPQLFTTTFTKARRGKRVYLDYLRNGFAQTAVAPYVVRAIEGGPISFPVRWEELDDEAFHPQRYTLRNAMDVLQTSGDAWADLNSARSRLGDVRLRLDKFLGR